MKYHTEGAPSLKGQDRRPTLVDTSSPPPETVRTRPYASSGAVPTGTMSSGILPLTSLHAPPRFSTGDVQTATGTGYCVDDTENEALHAA